jgi:organic hydroperoxide reductase OsmC/OhrA
MQEFTATIAWARGDQPFADKRYSRAHTWRFDGGLEVPASSSPLSVPLPMSVAANVDPEEALVASVSSCHMLWFLAVAAAAGLVVDSYADQASGTMEKDARGKLSMTRIDLHPAIRFSGRQPDRAELEALHHHAHDECYIANSIRAEVTIHV